jgi:imidazoleglycerol-phosphate dehydratase/histidinol-phosphatase
MKAIKMKNILWIDRDGTLVEEPEDFQVDALEKIRFKKGVIPALRTLKAAGFQLVMVSNQDGLGSSNFASEDFQMCHDFILQVFSSQDITFDAVFICPHRAEDSCACRKPKTGLLTDFLKQNAMNSEQSWVIGDRATDQQLAANLGVSYMPIMDDASWSSAVSAILARLRSNRLTRQTKETSIELSVMLDSNEASDISTPIPFFTHMLEQVAQHGGFSLKLHAEGDMEVDDHHVVEDTAIALGEALRHALSTKKGIARYGFTLPMDESLATIAIDLSGRSFCAFRGEFSREFVGNMATEMVPHFFKSFADGLKATIHIQTQGENHHHMIEACFKVLGRALRQAMMKTGDALPSTKGVL